VTRDTDAAAFTTQPSPPPTGLWRHSCKQAALLLPWLCSEHAVLVQAAAVAA
jgi:hypothetical protein